MSSLRPTKLKLVSHAIAMNNRGVAALKADNTDLAREEFESAINTALRTRGCCKATTAAWRKPSITADAMEIASKQKRFQRKDYDEGMDVCMDPLFLNEEKMDYNSALSSILYNQALCFVQCHLESEAYTGFRAALRVFRACKCRKSRGNGVHLIHILMNLGRLEYRSGRYDVAMKTFTRALDTAKKDATKGNKRFLLLSAACQNCLSVLYFHLPTSDTSRALVHCHLALKTYKSVLGVDSSSKEVATVLNNSGRIIFLLEDYETALSVYREALAMRRSLLGDDDMDVAATVFNIAQTSHSLHDYNTALSCYEEYFIIAQRHLGENHRDIAATKKSMAEVYHDLQQYDKALKLYLEALDIGKKTLGECDSEVAGILNKLGNLYYEQHNLDAALEAYMEELHIERSCLGDCHPNVAITCTNIGQIFKRQNNFPRALTMYSQAIAIQRRLIKDPSADVAATLSAIAFIYSQTKRLEEAFAVYQEVLWIQRETVGEQSLESSSTLNSIGLVLFKMEQHELALESFHESLCIRRKAHGDHHDVGVVLFNIATVHLDLREDDEALKYYHETLRVEERAAADSKKSSSKEKAAVLKHIGQVHQKNGRLEEALCFYHKALDDIARAATEEQDQNAEISSMLVLMGSVHLQCGRAKEVVEICSTALRHLYLAGMDIAEFQLYGFNFYSLSKMHPNAASAA